MFDKQTDPSAINPCQRAGLLSALAITVLCTTCAPSANTSEIPHPPFTAERFFRLYDEAIYECLHQSVYKAKEIRRRADEHMARELASTSHIANVSGVIEAENQEFEKLFREEDDCYIAAQIKWGVTQPFSSDKFEKMKSAIREQCDKSQEKRWEAMQRSLSLERGQNHDPTAGMPEFSRKLGDIIADRDQCYREIQTEWGFK
jgi:hypothetical protein